MFVNLSLMPFWKYRDTNHYRDTFLLEGWEQRF
jgi:hypothetical protein